NRIQGTFIDLGGDFDYLLKYGGSYWDVPQVTKQSMDAVLNRTQTFYDDLAMDTINIHGAITDLNKLSDDWAQFAPEVDRNPKPLTSEQIATIKDFQSRWAALSLTFTDIIAQDWDATLQ